MVSGVSLNVANNNNVKFVKDALKYTQGQKIQEDTLGSELASGIKGTTIFTAATTLPKAKRIVWSIKNRAEYGDTFAQGVDTAYDAYSAAKKAAKETKAITKIAKKTGKTVEEIKSEIEAAKAAEAAKEAAKEASEVAGKAGALTKLSSVVKKGIGKVFAPFKKAGALVGEKTGLTKLATSFATKFPKAAKLLKGSKGFFLFNMAISAMTEVVPAFKKGGILEGIKQTAKTLLRSGSDAIGFTAGMELGSVLGTAIFPGAGTVIGGLIGSALGMIIGGAFSTISSKAIDKTLGEDFSKQQAKAEEQAQAEEIANDPEKFNELKELVEAKIAEDTQSGKKKAIKNANIMQKELQNISKVTNNNATRPSTISFNATNSNKAINNSVRLNSVPQASAQQSFADDSTATVWSPKTVGEAMSGLYNKQGQFKAASNFQTIA